MELTLYISCVIFAAYYLTVGPDSKDGTSLALNVITFFGGVFGVVGLVIYTANRMLAV